MRLFRKIDILGFTSDIIGNMTKWADFLISAVRYSKDHKFITEVKGHEDKDDSLGQEMIVDRATVADNVKKGRKYMTVYSAGNNWRKGNMVRSFILDGEVFIRSDKNKVGRDNLGTLPQF